MVAPISVKVEEGKGGKVEISEGEYNSNGFSLNGLDPFECHSAGIACWLTGPKPAVHEWPNNKFFGSYVEAGYGGTPDMTKAQALASKEKYDAPYDIRYNTNRVVNNTDGSIVGYKYFLFDAKRLATKGNLMFILSLIPEGIEGDIDIMQDRPWISQGGKKIGEIHLLADMKREPWKCAVGIDKTELVGLHAIYLVFKSDTKEKSLCTLENFYFAFDVK